ncbi:unnamed protein product [Calypogeia fissa]
MEYIIRGGLLCLAVFVNRLCPSMQHGSRQQSHRTSSLVMYSMRNYTVKRAWYRIEAGFAAAQGRAGQGRGTTVGETASKEIQEKAVLPVGSTALLLRKKQETTIQQPSCLQEKKRSGVTARFDPGLSRFGSTLWSFFELATVFCLNRYFASKLRAAAVVCFQFLQDGVDLHNC